MERYSNRIITFSLIFLVYLLAWHWQASLLLNSDVSFLTYEAKRLMSGGKYATDFFETNPPLIIYLHTPLLFLQHFFHLSQMLAFRIYIFSIATISLMCCSILLKHIILAKDKLIRFILIAVLCSLFLIIPVADFGQREHITVLLITPYILLMVTKLQKKNISSRFEIIISIMAGIGFAIKPYFYFPLLLLEIYYAYSSRSFSTFLRREMLIISIIGCTYLTTILLYHYNYISIIIPLIRHTYYAKYQQPIKMLIFSSQSILGYFLIVLYAIRYRYHAYKQLSTVLLISAVGFWLVFLFQQMGWYYHALPFYTYDLLLYSLLFSLMITQKTMTKIEYILIGIMSALLLSYYYFYMPYIGSSTLYYSNTISLWKSDLLTLLIILLFLLIPRTKLKCGYLAVLGLLVFIYPFYKTAYLLTSFQDYKNLYQHLIVDMKPYAKKKVYFFTGASELAFPLVDYANLNYVSRFWSMSWLPLMKPSKNADEQKLLYQSHRQEMDFYINGILDDFTKYQPSIVLVDIRKKGYFFNISLDYINLFSNNDSFKTQWHHYHLVKIIDYPPLYKFAVYAIENT